MVHVSAGILPAQAKSQKPTGKNEKKMSRKEKSFLVFAILISSQLMSSQKNPLFLLRASEMKCLTDPPRCSLFNCQHLLRLQTNLTCYSATEGALDPSRFPCLGEWKRASTRARRAAVSVLCGCRQAVGRMCVRTSSCPSRTVFKDAFSAVSAFFFFPCRYEAKQGPSRARRRLKRD